MPDPFDKKKNSVHPFQQIRRQIAQKLAPLGTAWAKATAPLRAFFAPLTQRLSTWTAPMRARWNAFRERRPTLGRIFKWMGLLIGSIVGFIVLLVLCVWMGVFGRLPNSEELRNIETANATEIYTADSVLIGRFYIENRTAITIENISPTVISALIATEDRRFLEHRGVDFQSWFRVGYGMISGKGSGGGSTLSQQLAKNLYGRPKYWIPGLGLIVSKIRENFISVRLERIYNKQQILALYLNTVPFGGDVYGINVAAKQYFNKKPKDLSPDQAATLIGMLKGTTLYHPVRNPENARKRRNVVLQQMVRNGDLTQKEYEELSKKPVGAKYYNMGAHNEGLGTYFREYLRTELMPDLLKKYKKEDGTDYNLYTDGLKIYTTVNSTMQKYAEEAVQKHLQELQKQFDNHWKNFKKEKPWGDDKWIDEKVRSSERWADLKEAGVSKEDAMKEFQKPVRMTVFSWKGGGSEVDTTLSPLDSVRYYFLLLNCGFMAMDHRNGYVRAWVGGTNFKYFKFDHVRSSRQVGSTFKPIVYAAALRDSVKPCDYFANQIHELRGYNDTKAWAPHNADETYGGYYSMAGALARSVNVVTAQLIEKAGIRPTIELAHQMGITSELPIEFGISLGTADASLYDMMKVYGTLANNGKRPEPVVVTKVVERNGEVLYDYKEDLKENPNLGAHVQALTPDQATTMTEMLQGVINYGTGARFRQFVPYGSDFAGKTGTTQNQSDGWFICYNPQLVTGAWVGAESPAVHFRYMALGQGSAMALPIVGWFWNKMANDKKYGKLLQEKFPDPKPEIRAHLGCYPWISINSDSLSSMLRDSTRRDSAIAKYTTRPGKTPPGGESDGADGKDGDKKKDDDKDKKGGNIFQKIFGKKPEDEKEKKRQQ